MRNRTGGTRREVREQLARKIIDFNLDSHVVNPREVFSVSHNGTGKIPPPCVPSIIVYSDPTIGRRVQTTGFKVAEIVRIKKAVLR